MTEMRRVQPLFSTQVRETETRGGDPEEHTEPQSAGPEALKDSAFSWSPVAGIGWSYSSLPPRPTYGADARSVPEGGAALDATRSLSATAGASREATSGVQSARERLEQAARILKQSRPKRGSQLQASLSQASARMMTAQFTVEVRRVLKEQELILPMLETSREWALKVLNRQYYAIRTAAELLRQDNLATVAGRAEVLVSLLSRNRLAYRTAHGDVLRDTWELLSSVCDHIRDAGSDKLCFAAAKTAICLFATAEPQTEGYAPAAPPQSRSTPAR